MIEYIGIDLGGTNIRVGAIDENEKMIYDYKEQTFTGVDTADDLYNKIVRLIKSVPNYQEAKAIGLGVPGSVDINTKRIITAKNMGILIDYPLAEKIKEEFGKPVAIDNDGKVTALAEAVGGSGKGMNIVCYVTISTGLGGGLVINKKIYRGSNSLGGYLARIIVDGEHTSDSMLSGRALCAKAREMIDTKIENTEELFILYKEKNEKAVEIVNEFKKNLTVLMLNISATFNPDIIVFGGGVIKSREYFLDDVKEDFYNKVHPLGKNTKIDICKYEEPGIIGACFLAKYE